MSEKAEVSGSINVEMGFLWFVMALMVWWVIGSIRDEARRAADELHGIRAAIEASQQREAKP